MKPEDISSGELMNLKTSCNVNNNKRGKFSKTKLKNYKKKKRREKKSREKKRREKKS